MSVQSQEESCWAPRLDGGYVVPAQQSYTHGSSITYACDNGRKPAVESWWATSSCQNGEWQPAPQCIDEKSCLPPVIHNAQYTENPHGWYSDSEKIRITCNSGYEFKNQDTTAVCKNGTWTSVPTCDKSNKACDAPPKIPHAVIINQEYHDLFPEDSIVTYQCEDGFTVGGDATEQLLYCIVGNWTQTQPCMGGARPGVGHGGGASGGGGAGNTGGGHSGVSAGRDTQPAGGGGGPPGDSGLGSSVDGPPLSQISRCGEFPILTNGAVARTEIWSLTYECSDFYKLEGPAQVMCYSSGSWSELPTCKVNFCTVDTADYADLLQLGQLKYIKERETQNLDCRAQDYWSRQLRAVFSCRNGRISRTECCREDFINYYSHCTL
ncbi:complement factor H-like [Myripristis murdjan]|uniref:complement factor H-like n=1 Tax=Myripristis murdjan TaxID=586833 RepID=UPI0011760AFE|nr:complement factor H-like [Myripristis murdjan]